MSSYRSPKSKDNKELKDYAIYKYYQAIIKAHGDYASKVPLSIIYEQVAFPFFITAQHAGIIIRKCNSTRIQHPTYTEAELQEFMSVLTTLACIINVVNNKIDTRKEVTRSLCSLSKILEAQ